MSSHPPVSSPLSHLDSQGRARMVDVSQKSETTRVATAESIVRLPSELAQMLRDGDPRVQKKGSVLAVAELAGIMGGKRTSELIPLCHGLNLEHLDVTISWATHMTNTLLVSTTARSNGKTGVEMEALTAASIASLTVYDMCKAVSHDIILEGPRLLHKSGGKSLVSRPSRDTPLQGESQQTAKGPSAPLWGLLLAGGRSSRMGRDKAWLPALQRAFPERPSWQHLTHLMRSVTQRQFVSCRADQAKDFQKQNAFVLVDSENDRGPAWAIVEALELLPEESSMGLLVLACDLPLLDEAALQHLANCRNPRMLASSLCKPGGLPEPLIAIWEKAAQKPLMNFLKEGGHCPRKFLMQHDHQSVPVLSEHWIFNANTPAEQKQATELAAFQSSPHPSTGGDAHGE